MSLLAALTLAATPVVAAQAATAPSAAPAPVAPLPALSQRASDLIAVLNGSGDVAALFAPTFLAQVPEAQLRSLMARFRGDFGDAVSIAALEPVTPSAARIRIAYQRGEVSMNLAVEEAAPNRIVGLRITGTVAPEATLDAVIAALKAEHGVTGFALATLGDDAPHVDSSLSPDRAGAIGSAFKLAILAELIRETNAGERHWDDPVTLGGAPLPGGRYTQKPAGTQVPLRELAQAMISVSDNSAADVLLKLVGRERIEALLPALGWHDAARNRPFVSTLEMFKLKGLQGGAFARRWPMLTEPQRRTLLAREIAAAPLSAIDPQLFRDGKPVLIDAVEWYASPADLIRTMDWIRRHSETGPGAEARAILAINSGIGPAAAGAWRYVGYKGGSEPGVLAMSFLLQGKDGRWRAAAAYWNDAAAPVEEARFIALITRALTLAAR